jgi:hypothetical protein
MLTPLRQEIVTKLEAISEIAEVHFVEPAKFESYPAAVVDLTESENDYGSTNRRRLVYEFEVRVYYKTETSKSRNDVELALMEVYDKVLNAFIDPNSLTNAFEVRPVPSNWLVLEAEESTYRIATMYLNCVQQVEID